MSMGVTTNSTGPQMEVYSPPTTLNNNYGITMANFVPGMLVTGWMTTTRNVQSPHIITCANSGAIEKVCHNSE